MPKMPEAMAKAIIDRRARAQRARAGARVLPRGCEAPRRAGRGRLRPHGARSADRPGAHRQHEEARHLAGGRTLSREASMFAYGSTPGFASDPFFTRGVSAKTLELIKSPERQKTIASGPNFRSIPPFFETAKANFKRLVDAGIPYAAGTDSGPPGRFPGLLRALGAAVDGGSRTHAGAGHRRRHAPRRDVPRRRGSGNAGADQVGRLRRARWEPARGYQQ